MTVIGWFFRDRRSGRIVIFQWPNVALLVWLGAKAAAALFDLDTRVVATLALGWWAADEIVRGVNPWRRLLGTVVLAGLLASLR